MKWPGLKLGSKNHYPWARTAHEVAEDNAVMSAPAPDPKEIQKAIVRAAKALVELEASIVRMLTGKKRK